jgi:hypothetical protein
MAKTHQRHRHRTPVTSANLQPKTGHGQRNNNIKAYRRKVALARSRLTRALRLWCVRTRSTYRARGSAGDERWRQKRQQKHVARSWRGNDNKAQTPGASRQYQSVSKIAFEKWRKQQSAEEASAKMASSGRITAKSGGGGVSLNIISLAKMKTRRRRLAAAGMAYRNWRSESGRKQKKRNRSREIMKSRRKSK